MPHDKTIHWGYIRYFLVRILYVFLDSHEVNYTTFGKSACRRFSQPSGAAIWAEGGPTPAFTRAAGSVDGARRRAARDDVVKRRQRTGRASGVACKAMLGRGLAGDGRCLGCATARDSPGTTGTDRDSLRTGLARHDGRCLGRATASNAFAADGRAARRALERVRHDGRGTTGVQTRWHDGQSARRARVLGCSTRLRAVALRALISRMFGMGFYG